MERSLKRICILAICILSFIPGNSFAQDDMGVWMDFVGEKKLSKKFSVEGEVEYRSRENAAEIDCVTLGADAEYKFSKHLKGCIGYTFLYDNKPSKTNLRQDESIKWIRPNYWLGSHRAFVQATGDVDLGRWNIALRERYQYTYRPETTVRRDYYTRDNEYNYSEDDIRESKQSHTLRSRLQVSYDIAKCPVQPFASVECNNALVAYDDTEDPEESTGVLYLERVRTIAGIDWKVSKKVTATAAYLFQANFSPADPTVRDHAISISLKYKF